jgi:hypothetical protein
MKGDLRTLSRGLAPGLGRTDLATYQSQRLEDLFIAECRLLIPLLAFWGALKLIRLLAMNLLLGCHSFTQARTTGCSPNPIEEVIGGSVLHVFPARYCPMVPIEEPQHSIE